VARAVERRRSKRTYQRRRLITDVQSPMYAQADT
jgi:hypothetical protein